MGLKMWFSLLLILWCYEINSFAQNFTNNISTTKFVSQDTTNVLHNSTISLEYEPSGDFFKNISFSQKPEFANNKITQKLLEIFEKYRHEDQSIVLLVIQNDPNNLANMVLKNLFSKYVKVVVLQVGSTCNSRILNQVN